ncbi:zinc-dependent metalloprotease, partial [Acinetobacter baumannii]
DMNGHEAEALAQAVVKDVIMHEVGHTLGLKHNFRSSTTVTQEQLKDKAYTEANGISNSVMDYNAYNLPLKGEPRASLTNTTLGAYDYWAI